MTPDFNDAEFQQERNAIQTESLGWLPLGQGAYLHKAAQLTGEQNSVIEVVGVADASMAELNVLWLV